MADFLSELSGALEETFNLGENKQKTLDLGDFTKKIDQSQQRQYVEQGYLRTDSFNSSAKQFEVLFQQPDTTVLVKKRAFASLAENFRTDYMDKDEKLFYKATKVLFQNKCKQISQFEKLCKIHKIAVENGLFSTQLVPLIISLVDNIGTSPSSAEDVLQGNANPDAFEGGLKTLKNTIDKIRKIYSFSANSQYTTWLTDNSGFSQSMFGNGSGVIEFTNITGLNVSHSVSLQEGGSITLNMVDPYNLMTITQADIEKALSDTTNLYNNHKFSVFGKQNSEVLIANAKKQLNDKRRQRGASEIQFYVNPDTILGKRVRAVIDGAGIEINFDFNAGLGLLSKTTVSPESLRGGPEVGEQGLDTAASNRSINTETGVVTRKLISTSEVSLFGEVIDRIFNNLQLEKNSQSIIKQYSDQTNYARRKLELHYLGKCIIQPMDQVHVYLSSKTRLDSKILGGLQQSFSGLGILQDLNNTWADVKNQFQSLFNPSGNANFQLEKSIFVGSDFPNWLWTILRNQFVNDLAGTHVFGGVITGATSRWSDGKYTVNVSGKDNTYYLQLGRINTKPSVEVFNGEFLDPLTKFKTRFDGISSSDRENPPLLEENEKLIQSGLLKFKAGPKAGEKITIKNYLHDNQVDQNTQAIKKVFYSPDGLVYRWKEGIGTFTAFSKAFDIDDQAKIGSPNMYQDPFAGQDVMNVISLAITGTPYNYGTYFKNLQDSGAIRDPQSGEDAAQSFFKSLSLDLAKNNLLWGNFIPFKNLVMDEQSFSLLTSVASISNENKKAEDLINKIRDISNAADFDQRTEYIKKKQTDLAKFKEELTAIQQGIYNQIKNTNQNISIAGNDISYETSDLVSNNQKLSDPATRKELRRKVNFLTRRLGWQVRGNEDRNLLIIDDTYDKDYDILAFEKALIGQDGLQAFNSDYSSMKNKVETAANLLNLEVFCNSQGHIVVRPPQYNKIPSSVFYRLIQQKKSKGIQILPPFMEELFTDQLKTLIQRIEIVEDQIRLDAATLGKNTDSEVQQLVYNTTTDSGIFNFISNENGDIINENDINKNKNPDEKQSLSTYIDTLAGSKNKLETQGAIKRIFTNVARAQFILNFKKDGSAQAATTQSSTRIKDLVSRLNIKTGQPTSTDQFLSADPTNSVSGTNPPTIDVFKVTKDLAEKIGERQKLVKLASNALKNAQEAISIDKDKSISTKLLMPDITGKNSNVPEMYEHMIEDESYDDYGPNSGKRYIIKNRQIINLEINENPPNFTMVTVQGQFNPYLSNNQLPSDLNLNYSFDRSGGNSMITAAAIDYDMWRMYGLRETQNVPAPFLSSPQAQCAPFALSLLTRARADILNGTVTISGNEYMQAGEVVYLEDRALLFYVHSVSHNFNYGVSFTTTLTLKYGHPPGTFTPTTLDIIGKLLYKNRDVFNYVNYRQVNVLPQKSIGVLIFDKRVSGQTVENIMTEGSYGDHNVKVMNDILNSTYLALNSNTANSGQTAKIELRIYNDSGTNATNDPKLVEAANFVRDILTGAKKVLSVKSPLANLKFTAPKESILSIEETTIDLSGKIANSSPSQKAWDMVRNISSSVSTGDKLGTVLAGYIIDCWITFRNNEKKQ